MWRFLGGLMCGPVGLGIRGSRFGGLGNLMSTFGCGISNFGNRSGTLTSTFGREILKDRIASSVFGRLLTIGVGPLSGVGTVWRRGRATTLLGPVGSVRCGTWPTIVRPLAGSRGVTIEGYRRRGCCDPRA